ncbi:MAG: hypothetical protein WCS18_11435 [Sphaerochaetaceae bacterium]
MTETPKHAIAAESQFASGCLCDAQFARDFSEIAVAGLSAVKALDWLVPVCRNYVKKYGEAPGADILPYAEAAVRSCDLPEEAMAFFAAAAKNPPKNIQALLARAQKHYHLLSRQRHADRIQAAIMADDEEGIAEADLELKAHKMVATRWGRPESILDKRGNAAMFENIPKPIIRLPGHVGQLLNRALTRDALVLGVASAKIGKTSIMSRITFEGGMAGLKGLYVTIGDDKIPRIRRRLYSCFSGRPVGGEYEAADAVPIVVCKRGAKGECKRCSGTHLAPFPPDDVIAKSEPEELMSKYPDFVPCRDCWRNGKADHPDFQPMVWWTKDESVPMTPEEADGQTDAMASMFREGDVHVMFRPKSKLTTEELEDVLDSEADESGRPYDFVTIDYPDMMKLPRGREDHEQMRAVWEELRNISAERDMLVLAVTQANRTGGVVETQTMETVGRTKTAIDNCTTAFSANQTAAERSAGVMRISVMAAREFKFAPEHQALCCSWLHVQDPFAESFHVYRKIKEIVR